MYLYLSSIWANMPWYSNIGSRRNYFQLYFYDIGNELHNRMRIQYNENLSAKVMEKLMSMCNYKDETKKKKAHEKTKNGKEEKCKIWFDSD